MLQSSLSLMIGISPHVLYGLSSQDPQPVSTPDKLYFAQAGGTRLHNKDGNLGAGYTKFGQYTNYAPLAWDVPAGGRVCIAYPNFYAVEANNVESEKVPGTGQIEACALSYTDANNVVQNVVGTMSNAGTLSAALPGGGVIVTFVLPTMMPKTRSPRIGLAVSAVDGARLPCGGALSSGVAGELARKHTTTSFATVVQNRGSLTSITGTTGGNWSGYYIHPAFFAADGADGRPVVFLDGDSIGYGKGTPDEAAPQRVAGIVEVALNSTTNGYQIPLFNSTIAGTGYHPTDPADALYNPKIRNLTRALVDQLTEMNGGIPPYTHAMCQHGNNSIAPDGVQQVALMKTRHKWLTDWHEVPIIQTTMTPKATSSDGFRTLENQVVGFSDALGSGGRSRWGFNDALLANKLDGTVAHAVNTYAAISYDQAENRDKFAIAPFTATLTRAVTAGISTLFLDKAPPLGSVLCLDPLSGTGASRAVISVAEITPNVEYQITVSGGGTYAAKPIGTLVGEHLTADSPPSSTGLHISRRANEMIAAWQGPNSYVQLKADLKAAVAEMVWA